MKLNSFIIMISLFFCSICYAQEQQTIYYDNDWKNCTEAEAKFYRLVTFDENGKPKGEVRDYYITGELQWIGQFSEININNHTKDIPEGKVTWYHKNGNKSMQATFTNGKENGPLIFWHENGKLKEKSNYTNGEFLDKYYISCDEFGKCKKNFLESFYNNKNNWTLKGDYYTSKVTSKKGMLMKSKSKSMHLQTVNVPLDQEKEYLIGALFNFKRGNKQHGHGIIWGHKDWDNFYFFQITPNGYYYIGGYENGVKFFLAQGRKSDDINTGKDENLIQLLHKYGESFFIINSSIVHQTSEVLPFFGYNVGLNLDMKKKVLFREFSVSQEIENTFE